MVIGAALLPLKLGRGGKGNKLCEVNMADKITLTLRCLQSSHLGMMLLASSFFGAGRSGSSGPGEAEEDERDMEEFCGEIPRGQSSGDDTRGERTRQKAETRALRKEQRSGKARPTMEHD